MFAGCEGRITIEGGSFFERVPDGCDCVQIMARSTQYSLDAANRSLGTSISLDDAIAACSFQPAAQPCCLFCRCEGTHKSSIVGARSAEIGAANDRLSAAKLVGVFRLQRPKRSVSPAFTALRGNLNSIAAA